MIHPKTELKFISSEIGYGIFASEDLPAGTIVYVKDAMEISIEPIDYLQMKGLLKDNVDRFSYIDEYGNRIVSWDLAKYVNHCCDCNTISTGYGFEIAIKDIKKGDQITDEYGIFNLDQPMEVSCGKNCCRNILTNKDFENHYKEWDEKIKKVIQSVFKVDQALIDVIDEQTQLELEKVVLNLSNYRSVYSLRYQPELHNKI